MFSNAPLNRLRRSLAVRLSAWFALLFTAGFTAIFALLYWTLTRSLEAQDSDALQLRLQQYTDIYAAHGLSGLRERVAEDSQAPHVRSLFMRIVGPGGNAVWGKIPPDWIASDVQRIEVPSGWVERRIYNVRVPRDEEQDLTVVSRSLVDGLLLQVGRSTDSRAVVLAPLRRTFLWVGAGVMAAGFGAGIVTARRATRPLRDVVATARRIIATGELDARVPAPKRDDDVAELVRAFNTVLDKNAGLLRAMREALDNVAHDLRTPLTRLRGTAELALRSAGGGGKWEDEGGGAARGGESNKTELDMTNATGEGGGEQREALAECVEQADEVLRLLRALMEISEAEGGMLRLDKSACDVGGLARAAVELYTEVAESKPVTLSVEAAMAAPVFADATRLRQAIANLVDNAVKYTPAGGHAVLRVTVEGEENATGLRREAVLTVSDTGPGVPLAEQPRVWERLYRGDASRAERGLGLGLSLVRVIIEAHGGRVAVRNGAEGGAVFELRLPLAATDSAAGESRV